MIPDDLREKIAPIMAAAWEMAQDAADRMNLPYKYGEWPIPEGAEWYERAELERVAALVVAEALIDPVPLHRTRELQATVAALRAREEGE